MVRNSYPSRLLRNSKRQNKKQIYLSILAIIVISILFVRFLPTILGGIGKVSQAINSNDTANEKLTEEDSLLLPPRLEPVVDATSSAYIRISGEASENGGVIEILINNSVEEEVSLDDTTSFSSKLLKLKDGENTIKARHVKNSLVSEYSEIETVTVLKKQPTLEIDSPKDGDSFSKADKRITVQGKTDPENIVTVNESRAVVDQDGGFSYLFDLQEGDNKIVVKAENPAGGTIEKELKVTYSRE